MSGELLGAFSDDMFQMSRGKDATRICPIVSGELLKQRIDGTRMGLIDDALNRIIAVEKVLKGGIEITGVTYVCNTTYFTMLLEIDLH